MLTKPRRKKVLRGSWTLTNVHQTTKTNGPEGVLGVWGGGGMLEGVLDQTPALILDPPTCFFSSLHIWSSEGPDGGPSNTSLCWWQTFTQK